MVVDCPNRHGAQGDGHGVRLASGRNVEGVYPRPGSDRGVRRLGENDSVGVGD